ncbi:MAG: tetratricopeptide repeat protein [Gemmatimonadota bacterium]
MKRTVGLLLLGCLAGCAYYNGMYNARRLAHQAEKAEREGRTFDAASLWGQAGVKADTMLARHGSSTWADDALLIRGKAFQRLGDCSGAITTLRRLLASSTDSLLVEEGSFLLGNCYQRMNDPEEATAAFAVLINSHDPERRREALYQHGHSLVLGDRFQEALGELERTDHPRAAGERAAALAGLGRTSEALVIADSLLVAQDTAASWALLLSLIGRVDPVAASGLVNRVVSIPHFKPELAGELLLADGRRLLPHHPELAEKQLTGSVQAAPNSQSSNIARFDLLRMRIERVTDIDSLTLVQREFSDVQQIGGNPGILIGRYDRAAGTIRELADSVAGGSAGPDIRLFMAAELARDSLEMTGLAANIFARIARNYPESPYAPKAVLALMALEPGIADSAQTLLRQRYPESPYLLAWDGQPAPTFTHLEDSLAAFASKLHRPARVNSPTRTTTRPAQGTGLPQN